MAGVVYDPPGPPQALFGINVLEDGKLTGIDILGSLYYTLQVFMVESSAVPKTHSR